MQKELSVGSASWLSLPDDSASIRKRVSDAYQYWGTAPVKLDLTEIPPRAHAAEWGGGQSRSRSKTALGWRTVRGSTSWASRMSGSTAGDRVFGACCR